MGVHYDNMKLH